MKPSLELFSEHFDIRAKAEAELANARVQYEKCVLGDGHGETFLRNYLHTQLDIILDSINTQSLCVKTFGEKREQL